MTTQIQNSEVQKFIEQLKPYCKGEPKHTDTEISIIIQSKFLTDKATFKEINEAATKIGATRSFSNGKVGFRILKTIAETQEASCGLLFLHESDIEDGGPQPRLKIEPDDPDTVALYVSIKADRADNDRSNILGQRQRDPVDVYPSPLGNGKHRICEGHRRCMVVFNMLRLEGIWAQERKRTELQAYEDSLILNGKKGLSAMDKAHQYKIMLEKFPDAYPTLEALGKKVGETKQVISLILLAYQEIEKQKPLLSPELSTRVDNLPEQTIRQIRKAPEELKPAIIEATIKNDLSFRQTEKLVTAIKNETTPDEKTVAEKVAALYGDAKKEVSSFERLIEKLTQNTQVMPPEAAVREAVGRAGDNKVTSEKLGTLMTVYFQILDRHAREAKKSTIYFEEAETEASKW